MIRMGMAKSRKKNGNENPVVEKHESEKIMNVK
jgi:hypothetical protein